MEVQQGTEEKTSCQIMIDNDFPGQLFISKEDFFFITKKYFPGNWPKTFFNNKLIYISGQCLQLRLKWLKIKKKYPPPFDKTEMESIIGWRGGSYYISFDDIFPDEELTRAIDILTCDYY